MLSFFIQIIKDNFLITTKSFPNTKFSSSAIIENRSDPMFSFVLSIYTITRDVVSYDYHILHYHHNFMFIIYYTRIFYLYRSYSR